MFLELSFATTSTPPSFRSDGIKRSTITDNGRVGDRCGLAVCRPHRFRHHSECRGIRAGAAEIGSISACVSVPCLSLATEMSLQAFSQSLATFQVFPPTKHFRSNLLFSLTSFPFLLGCPCPSRLQKRSSPCPYDLPLDLPFPLALPSLMASMRMCSSQKPQILSCSQSDMLLQQLRLLDQRQCCCLN